MVRSLNDRLAIWERSSCSRQRDDCSSDLSRFTSASNLLLEHTHAHATYCCNTHMHTHCIGSPHPPHSSTSVSFLHSTLKTFLFCNCFPPRPSFSSFRTHSTDSSECLSILLSISDFLIFRFSLFHFYTLVLCGRFSWYMSAFQRTLK